MTDKRNMSDDISVLRIKAFRQIPLNRIFAYPIILDKDVPTPGCLDSQNRIILNPDLLEEQAKIDGKETALTSDFATIVLLHETLHDVLDHIPRRNVFLGERPSTKQFVLWNVACDVVINEMLLEWVPFTKDYIESLACRKTVDVPKDIPLVAEVIYRHLYNNTHVRTTKYRMKIGGSRLEVYEYEIIAGDGPDEERDLGDVDIDNQSDSDSQGNQQRKNNKGGQGDNQTSQKSNKELSNSNERNEKVLYKNVTIVDKSGNNRRGRAQFKYAFPELVEALKQAGKGTGDLEKELQFTKCPVDLTRYLNKYFDNIRAGLDDITFLRMSRLDYIFMRQQRRLKLPSYVARTVRTVIGIDSSGSISDDEYEKFISVIWKHKDMLEGKIAVCDDEIKKVLDLKDAKKSNLAEFLKTRKGYGGTSYKPVFELAERENVELVIYFTDLYPDEFPQNPKFKVIWVVKLSPETFSVPVPYGTVVWF